MLLNVLLKKTTSPSFSFWLYDGWQLADSDVALKDEKDELL